MPPNPQKEKWTHYTLIIGGSIIGLFIIIGFFSQLHSILSLKNGVSSSSSVTLSQQGPTTGSQNCADCLSEADNNKKVSITVGQEFTIDLPQNIYPKDNLTLISTPDDMFTETFTASPDSADNWLGTFQPTKSGTADIIVKSSQPSVSDFHVTITVN